MGDIRPFQNNMVNRPISETGTYGEAGMAGADDDGVDLRWAWLQDRSPVQLTSTVTLVGLVITSYTAERFCD